MKMIFVDGSRCMQSSNITLFFLLNVGYCHHTANIIVELHAISYGLQLTWNYGFPDIIGESDVQTILTFIQGLVLTTYFYTTFSDNFCSFTMRD